MRHAPVLEQTANRVALPPETLNQLQEVLGRMADREASGESFNRAFVGEKLDGLADFDMPPEKLQRHWDRFLAPISERHGWNYLPVCGRTD